MSTIIKASGSIRPADALAFNFDDMTASATGYLEQVRREAAQIIAKAQQEAIAISRHAEEAGRQAAMRAAERVLDEKVSQQMATLLPALRQAIDSISQAREDWLLHWEQVAVHVAAQIAARIVRRELSHDPQITLTLVREALELAAGSAEIRLRLHPNDYATLGQQIDQLTAQLTRAGDAKVIADPRITPGGCRVDTRFGTIDQQIEAQLARIEQELT
jgi:flagellar assembly protein FliH